MPDRLPWRWALLAIVLLSPVCGVVMFYLAALFGERAAWTVAVLVETVR
jgi:hypothetical protein